MARQICGESPGPGTGQVQTGCGRTKVAYVLAGGGFVYLCTHCDRSHCDQCNTAAPAADAVRCTSCGKTLQAYRSKEEHDA